ncbi:uncharacterized protein PgNI_12341 [Pyricularia grisea]|uniref:Uncharacterized protein n=1 Tax=Pyricularia grisea TaxID=148305 RepID=A0A6P8AN01_PYRGI|nr:uncharacterized protein PgNI_12341 [Pyricularia grisea]TLD03417.1 hypothetical protein PgNI_12341 [Pyricularia grisea]
MCFKVNEKYQCQHVKDSRIDPSIPEDCPQAVTANRRHRTSGHLLPCKNPPTNNTITGGYCERPQCHLWNTAGIVVNVCPKSILGSRDARDAVTQSVQHAFQLLVYKRLWANGDILSICMSDLRRMPNPHGFGAKNIRDITVLKVKKPFGMKKAIEVFCGQVKLQTLVPGIQFLGSPY